MSKLKEHHDKMIYEEQGADENSVSFQYLCVYNYITS